MHEDAPRQSGPERGADPPADGGVPGLCIIVTPPGEAVPKALADALAHHDATPVRARSPYHAIVRVARPSASERNTLLIVEPERCPHADSLALAAMAHAPDIAVWRYDPCDDAPVAPYVPDKPGVVPEPIEDLPGSFGNGSPGAVPSTPPPAPRIVGPARPDGLEPPAPADPSPPRAPEDSVNAPLVSRDELAMLLGDDDKGVRGR
ncbi:MAG: hypothetical protein AAGH64_07185 [Planctomycetota bacterium]